MRPVSGQPLGFLPVVIVVVHLGSILLLCRMHTAIGTDHPSIIHRRARIACAITLPLLIAVFRQIRRSELCRSGGRAPLMSELVGGAVEVGEDEAGRMSSPALPPPARRRCAQHERGNWGGRFPDTVPVPGAVVGVGVGVRSTEAPSLPSSCYFTSRPPDSG